MLCQSLKEAEVQAVPWVVPSAPADSCPGGIYCHTFFFLAGDLPGGIRLSLRPAGGKAGPLPQEGTETSGVLNVLNTQD